MLRDLLAPTHLSDTDVEHLDELASAVDGPRTRGMAGQLVVLSLPTAPAPETERAFPAAAAGRLDARVVVLGPEEHQERRGATVPDVARTASLFAALLVALHRRELSGARRPRPGGHVEVRVWQVSTACQ